MLKNQSQIISTEFFLVELCFFNYWFLWEVLFFKTDLSMSAA